MTFTLKNNKQNPCLPIRTFKSLPNPWEAIHLNWLHADSLTHWGEQGQCEGAPGDTHDVCKEQRIISKAAVIKKAREN